MNLAGSREPPESLFLEEAPQSGGLFGTRHQTSRMERHLSAAEVTILQRGPRSVDVLVIVRNDGQAATETKEWVARVGEVLVTGLINGNKQAGRPEGASVVP